MPTRERVEIHFGDGHVEVIDDISKAQDVIGRRHDEAAEVWVVSRNDLGLGRRVDVGSLGRGSRSRPSLNH